MEVGEKLKELNMTVDETDRLTKAFKDEKFREMLRDYAQEISDPENKERYEEEIKLLEEERGNSIEFIHPDPFRALKTSVNGKQKCFINICANDKIGKPECKCGVSEDGRKGQCWSLPHSLHPGRQDTDPKGNKIVIYDVIFHPDTLHIASKNKRFMDIVDGTAIQGIQNAFKVTLDKNNVREMNTRYKGTPQPCVIRKPIPGYKAKEPSEKPDPLAFPYPDERRPTTPSQSRPTDPPATKNSSDAVPKSFHIQLQETKEPTKPKYSVKYRSFVDLQDFRCSRDSARSPRPKEIVVVIDLPLLKSVTDTSLEVTEKSLLLDSRKPAYRLELPLAYPVDENKGEAKFNKQRGQLTVTLPVLPSNEAFHFAISPAATVNDAKNVGDDDGKGEENEEDTWKEQERESMNGEEKHRADEGSMVKEEIGLEEEDHRQQGRVEKGVNEEGQEQMRKGQESVVGEEENCRKQKTEGKKSKEVGLGVEGEAKWKKQNRAGQENVEEERGVEDQERDKIYESGGEEEEIWKEQKQECERDGKLIENQNIMITAECSYDTREEGEVDLNSCLELTPKMKTSDIQEEKEKTKENVQGNMQLEAEPAFLNHTCSEESHTAAAVSPTPATSHNIAEDRCISQETEVHASEMKSGNESGNVVSGSGKQDEREDSDDENLTTEQIFRSPAREKPPPVLLREIDLDGNETVISDHSTSAGFIFQNTLMFELD